MKILNLIALGCISLGVSCKQEEQLGATESSVKGSSKNADNVVSGDFGTVVFEEYFNNATTYAEKWTEITGNDPNSNIVNYQTADASLETRDTYSVLEIKAYKNSWGEYNSGRIKTKNYQIQKPVRGTEYRVRSNIKLIAKDANGFRAFSDTYGAWPAFWTVEENQWPTKGEIDVMEGYSKYASTNFGCNLFYGTRAELTC